MIRDYKSMSNDELREILTSAALELKSRSASDSNEHSKQHLYRISMRRTPSSEPKAFQLMLMENSVVPIPLLLDQVIGNTGKVIGGEFWLNDGDVVQKVAASGLVRHFIAWQGSFGEPDYDVPRVLEGETQAETAAKVEAFLRGDRTLLIRELEQTIAYSAERASEYAEEGKTDQYSKRVAEDYRMRIPRLGAMLEWARSTNAVAPVLSSTS